MERITYDKEWDYARPTHEYRYKLAGKYTQDGDTVVDMACGIGYGKEFLKGKYIGVDREPLCGNIVADLNTWKPDFEFDVAISFETLEHLKNYQNLVEILKKAKKYIIYSSPIIPTRHINKYHLQDFTYKQLRELFKGEIIHEEIQNDTYGIFVIKNYV